MVHTSFCSFHELALIIINRPTPLLTQSESFGSLDFAVLRVNYGKCSNITNTIKFLFLFSTKWLVIMTGIHKMLVGLANREDPDQTVFSEAV